MWWAPYGCSNGIYPNGRGVSNGGVPSRSVKLLRFELKADPGRARSGIVSMGRVYETEEGQPAGMHAAPDVRPLVPIQTARSLRVFRAAADVDGEAVFHYANPGLLLGPSQTVPYPPVMARLRWEAYIAAVLVGRGYRIDVEDADGLVLGYTLLLALAGSTEDGRRLDAGVAAGPVITTPDELEDYLTGENAGREYALDGVLRVDGLDRSTGRTSDLPLTFAQAIHAASQTAPLGESDLVAIGPLCPSVEAQAGDEAAISVEGLGTLALKITPDL